MPDWFSLLFRYRDKKSPDELGKYPLAVQVEAYPERRYLWTSRVMVICGIFSLCVTMMLAMTIYVLLPQKVSYPSLYEAQDYNNSLRQMQAAEVSASPEQLLTENAIRRYIVLRHEIPYSYADLAYRWDTSSEFYQLSSLGAYQQFIYKMDYEQMAKLMAMKMVRQVNVEWVRQLTDDLWAAQFTTTTTTKDYPTPAKAVWRAYLRVYFEDFNDDTDKTVYSHNPHGLKIRRYSVGYAGTGENSESYLQSAKEIFERHI